MLQPTRYQRDTRVGDYVLDAPLGAGAFGEVWRASRAADEREKVAVKLPLEERFVGYLRREGELIRRLRSPHVVEIIALDADHDPPYLAMELIEGPSLDKSLAQRPQGLRVDDAVSVLRGLLAAMEYAHGQGVVHRDLKPANVLLTVEPSLETGFNEWCVKVSDFGLSDDSADVLHSITQSISLARDARLVGTLAYLAPEVRDGRRPPDARSDLYAIGVMLFEMLTGQRPSGFDLPSALRGDVPAALDHVFRRLVCRHEQRYATAREAHHELNQRLAFGALEPPTAAVPDSPATLPPPLAPGGRLLIVEIAPGVPLELVRVPAGEFVMGAEPAAGHMGGDDDLPRQRVLHSRPFHIGRYEVTQRQWQAVMGSNPAKFTGEQQPVESVAFQACVEFCQRLTQLLRREVRLPTEAEWEYACRAGTQTVYNVGDVISSAEHANFDGTYSASGRAGPNRARPTPVGSFPPNAWGLHDMHGNVAEWCGDYFEPYRDALRIDPIGRGDGRQRVRRGGAFNDSAERVRSARREPLSVDHYLGGSAGAGLRVVVPVETCFLELGDGVRLELIEIPAGEFWMGSPLTEHGSADDEGPRKRVRFTRPFFMARTPVTWAQFLAVMHDEASQLGLGDPVAVMRDSVRHASIGDTWLKTLTRGIAGLAGAGPQGLSDQVLRQYPVVRVAYDQIDSFCRRSSARSGVEVRLPTEAEWEYACRAGTETAFNRGATLSAAVAAFGSPDVGWPPCPVASFAPNGWGLYDMHGLVHEICADPYAPYVGDPQIDPAPQSSSEASDYRVKRGGCFTSPAERCRSAAREYGSANRGDTGFRVVARRPG